MNLKDKLLTLKRKQTSVFIEELGESITVSEMSALDSVEYFQKVKESESPILILYYSITDENQNKLFTMEELKILESKSLKIINKLLEAANAVNFGDPEDIKKN
jgi:hypothetical protein